MTARLSAAGGCHAVQADDLDTLFYYEQRPTRPFTPMLTAQEMRQVFSASAASPLGRGSFGETWRLIGTDAGDVAAKVIIRADYPASRLAREVEGLQRTRSDNVVRLIATDEYTFSIGNRAVLLCEFVPGGDVATALGADSRPSFEQVHRFAAGLFSGIAAMHATATVHRDIKPENIALRNGDWASPVLLDLGLAKLLDADTLTAYPALLGTVPFMAPEQIRLEQARKGADMWAAGVVLHLLLTGRHPFFGPRSEAVHRAEALERIAAGPPALPEDVPEPLASVAMRLLEPATHARGSASRACLELAG
jgi:serine/threonine protein kinase